MASGVRTARVHRRITSADAVTTNNDKTVTSASADFVAADVGRLISGTNIPASTTIASVTSESEIELSANATAGGTGITLTIQDSPSIGGNEPITLYGWSVACCNDAITLRSRASNGPILGVSRGPVTVSDTVNLEPNGVRVDGPIYIEWATASYGDLTVHIG